MLCLLASVKELKWVSWLFANGVLFHTQFLCHGVTDHMICNSSLQCNQHGHAHRYDFISDYGQVYRVQSSHHLQGLGSASLSCTRSVLMDGCCALSQVACFHLRVLAW